MSPGDTVTSPARGRKSVQLPRQDSEPREGDVGRKSTQIARGNGPRPSRDFDVRRDGPYGRPSITMVRRRSSAFSPTGRQSLDVRRPSATLGALHGPAAPTPEELEMYPSAEENVAFEPRPPPLNYSLWDRRWFIAFFWGMILIDVIAQPIALYFSLWYYTNLSPNTVFSIITAALGGVSIFEYFLRFWRLWKKDSTCRVLGARRWYLDWFHWNFSGGWIIVMMELIVGSVPEDPPIRLLAMPLATMLFVFGVEMLVVDTMRYFQMPAPVRISSIPKGAQLRPAIYSLIEDIVAVDGSGGSTYREALNKRYESSHVFRAMLRRLGAFWMVGCNAMAVVTTILIFTIQHEAAYCVGWSAPFVWVAIWTAMTIWYVKRKLREEQTAWEAEIAEKQGAIAMSERNSERNVVEGTDGSAEPLPVDRKEHEQEIEVQGTSTATIPPHATATG